MRTTLLSAVAFAALFALLPGVSPAQDTPKPTPQHEALKKMEGTWTTTMKMAGGPSIPGEMTAKLELDGLWLVSNTTMNFGDVKFLGKGLDGYDTTKKEFVSVWVDNMTTTPMVLRGTYDEATKALTMTGEGPGLDGNRTKIKTISKSPDDNTHTFEMFSVGDDGKETAMFTIEYKRK